MVKLFFVLFIGFHSLAAQVPHKQAHAHNDYEHKRPLWDALDNGFISVEADVHLVNNVLLVSHNGPTPNAKTLQQLYLIPLDSLLARQGAIYPSYAGSFYLMIDSKTEAESTYRAIQRELESFKRLLCTSSNCPVKIFISGKRPLNIVMKEGYQGIGIDGRPNDLGKGFSSEVMPVVSDNYSNWATWKGETTVKPNDLIRIRELAIKVHAEGKLFRLWASPDNERAWAALMDAGVDFINTDRLSALHQYLSGGGNKK